MPKEKSSRSSSSQKHRSHPYMDCENDHTDSKKKSPEGGTKDWEDAKCPICMDHPHNAVLLICSSHDKGCRPYICNTSYRHSNCLDQYWKDHSGVLKNCESREYDLDNPHRSGLNSRSSQTTGRGSTRTGPGEAQYYDYRPVPVDSYEPHTSDYSSIHSSQEKDDVKGLACPLCRGKVYEWKVVAAAREHLNLKARSCAQESCSFTGIYEELRAHARQEHPFARPSDVDPVREREWRRLERRTDVGDVLSSIRSAMPHATVIGDYVIEDDLENDNENADFLGGPHEWWTIFCFLQVFGASDGAERTSPSRLRDHSRGRSRAHSTRTSPLHRSRSTEFSSALSWRRNRFQQQRNRRRSWRS